MKSLFAAMPRAAWKTSIASLLCLVSQSACSPGPAPSFSLFGSFFPAWMLCAFLGIIGAVAVRQVFIGINLDPFIPARAPVYMALAFGLAFGLWFLWFGR